MNNHLFLLTLGPVQSFIAQARKAQDLYAGSQILSLLVREGIKTFQESFPEGKIIFPSIKNGNKDSIQASLPNRFIAKISNHGYDDLTLKDKARDIEIQVKDLTNSLKVIWESFGPFRK